MHAKIYTLIFCFFLINSNYIQAADHNESTTKAINGWTSKQAGISYFTPIDSTVLSKIKAATIAHAHVHKIYCTEPSLRTLETSILSNIPELKSFLDSNNRHLSLDFLKKYYKNCLNEYKKCRIFTITEEQYRCCNDKYTRSQIISYPSQSGVTSAQKNTPAFVPLPPPNQNYQPKLTNLAPPSLHYKSQSGVTTAPKNTSAFVPLPLLLPPPIPTFVPPNQNYQPKLTNLPSPPVINGD